MENPFPKFPKTRPALPPDFAAIYQEQYINNRKGSSTASGLAQKVESWLHKMAASDVPQKHSQKTLEIGAGTLNQLKFESSDCYDIIEPFKELYSDSPFLKNIRNIFQDISQLDLNEQYQRIISIAAFEHILDLPKVVAKTCLILQEDGQLRTCIPNEGSVLWKLGWKLTTGLEFKLKYKLDYGVLMRHEHVNSANEIEEILNYFYDESECKVLGLNKTFGLYRFYINKKPQIERAKNYLARHPD